MSGAVEPTPQAAEAAREVVREDLAEVRRRLGAELVQMAGSHVLLTGGAGFLGFWLAGAIAAWNREEPRDHIHLTVLDTFGGGVPPWLAELEPLNVRCLRHDVTLPLPADAPPADWVLHAASIASPTFYRKRPLETMDANVQGLRLLLDRAREQAQAGHPVSGFLFFSTSEIYGDPPPEQLPTPESYRGNVSCTGPRAPYDESKRFGETLCTVYARAYGVPVRMVRPFNNYGPGLRLGDGRVLPDFARDVLEGRDVIMHSDGSPTRTFCYAADAAVGYLKALVRGRDGEPYNIGAAGPEVSVAELADRLVAAGREVLDYQGRVVRQESREAAYLVDNPVRRRPDVRKAAEELGFEARMGLDEGLRRSLLWYRGQPRGAEVAA